MVFMPNRLLLIDCYVLGKENEAISFNEINDAR